MRFPVYFTRRKGAGAGTVLGSEATPTISSAAQKTGDNILSHKLARPLNRVVVGYWYEGVGAVPQLPVSLWVWDDTSEKWYKADSATLTNGELTYMTVPALADPPQTSANMGIPQHGVEVMILIDDNSGGDGLYHFVAGPDTSSF